MKLQNGEKLLSVLIVMLDSFTEKSRQTFVMFGRCETFC